MPGVDLRNLTIEDTAALAGLPRVRHCRKCARCGGLLIEGFRERTGRNAYLFDFERKVWWCERCMEVVDR